VLVAYAAVPLLVSVAPFSMTSLARIGVDSTVLIFTLVLSVMTAILFAWAPVFETSRVSLSTTLGATQSSIAGGSTRAQGLLISLEVALAVLLLTAAGLMVKSLWRLHDYPAGFTPQDTYTMRIPLSGPRYEDLGARHAYLATLLERVEQTAGVEAAGLAGVTYNTPVIVGGGASAAASAADPDSPPPSVAVRMVSPAYLRAMGVSLVRGRWPTNVDALDVVVVNETFAKRVTPARDPIGQTIGGSFLTGTIVGIVADFTQASLDTEVMPELYYPYQRSPFMWGVQFAVRMPSAIVPDVRRLIEQIDRTQPVYQFQNLEQLLSDSIAPRRFNMFLLQVYAAAAAIMALVGTFGVVARAVSRRTCEIAIRIAIGARPTTVVALIVRQAMLYVLLGIGTGVTTTLAAGDVLRGLLYGVEPNDPTTLAALAAALTAAGFLACCLPATRAARIDPIEALRQE
jgi:putative ABC transport system permease protein